MDAEIRRGGCKKKAGADALAFRFVKMLNVKSVIFPSAKMFYRQLTFGLPRTRLGNTFFFVFT